ncbi:MAG: hypothetical protein F6K39_12510 [Okeania sp. SIO3B3]|nr:hypothetical protein [Okeania sp. SIO3B3]
MMRARCSLIIKHQPGGCYNCQDIALCAGNSHITALLIWVDHSRGEWPFALTGFWLWRCGLEIGKSAVKTKFV